MTDLVGNIHLKFNDIEDTQTLINLIKKHSYEWYLLPELGHDKNEHFHFYIKECRVTDRHLRRKIIELIPNLKKPIEGDTLNKDGTKKGWERKLKVSQIVAKKPQLTIGEEEELIKCYVFKDFMKPIGDINYFHYWNKIKMREPAPHKEYQNRYYELLQIKQDLHNRKNNQKAKEHREYLKILIEAYNKERTFINACGVEELRPHTIQSIIDFIIEDKQRTNKVMNMKQIENTAVTMLIHLDKEFKRLIKQRIKFNIENNYLC